MPLWSCRTPPGCTQPHSCSCTFNLLFPAPSIFSPPRPFFHSFILFLLTFSFFFFSSMSSVQVSCIFRKGIFPMSPRSESPRKRALPWPQVSTLISSRQGLNPRHHWGWRGELMTSEAGWEVGHAPSPSRSISFLLGRGGLSEICSVQSLNASSGPRECHCTLSAADKAPFPNLMVQPLANPSHLTWCRLM